MVASVAAFRNGKLLMGRRRDDGKWCCPGGHFESGEEPTEAARRELLEETGLEARALSKLGQKSVKNGEIEVHSFHASVAPDAPTNEDDPDGEFSRFKWIDPDAPPDDIMSNLHNPQDVTLQFLGVQRARSGAEHEFEDKVA